MAFIQQPLYIHYISICKPLICSIIWSLVWTTKYITYDPWVDIHLCNRVEVTLAWHHLLRWFFFSPTWHGTLVVGTQSYSLQLEEDNCEEKILLLTSFLSFFLVDFCVRALIINRLWFFLHMKLKFKNIILGRLLSKKPKPKQKLAIRYQHNKITPNTMKLNQEAGTPKKNLTKLMKRNNLWK